MTQFVKIPGIHLSSYYANQLLQAKVPYQLAMSGDEHWTFAVPDDAPVPPDGAEVTPYADGKDSRKVWTVEVKDSDGVWNVQGVFTSAAKAEEGLATYCRDNWDNWDDLNQFDVDDYTEDRNVIGKYFEYADEEENRSTFILDAAI